MLLERTQARGRLTKIKIIEAATELFYELGFYEVTFQKIADRAKITQPGIYNHFSNMDEIILAACQHWDGEAKSYMYRKCDEEDSAPEQIRNYIDRVLRYAKKNRSHDSLLIGLFYYAVRSKLMLAYYKKLTTDGKESLKKILIKGNAEGNWQIADPQSTVEFFHSLMLGEVFKILIEPSKFKIEDRVNELTRKILKVLGD